jgi:fatty acid synthase
MIFHVRRLFLNGTNFKPLLMFPSVAAPVSNSTPMISSLIEWDHSDNWPLPTAEDFAAVGSSDAGGGFYGTYEIDMSLPNSEYAFLTDHVVDGQMLFPATGYVVLAWRQLAKVLKLSSEQLPVIFENIDIHRTTVLSSSGASQLYFI